MSEKPIDTSPPTTNEDIDEKKKTRKTTKYERIRFRGKISEEEQVVFDNPEEFIKFVKADYF